MVILKLDNGKVIDNLKMNGTNFVSETEIDETMFSDIIKEICVIEDGRTYYLHNVEFIQQVKYADGYYFVLREMTPDEILRKQLMDSITDVQMAITEMYESEVA